MADNIDPQQIEQLNNNLAKLNETLGGVGSSGANAGQSLTNLDKGAQKSFTVFQQLSLSGTAFAKSMYSGEKASQQFATGMIGAIDLITVALGPLGLGARLALEGFKLLTKGISATVKQGEDLFKSYQDLSRSGATASQGITGVFNQMQNFGYGIEELDKMVKLVSENSETLAKFSLTAADGTNAFSGAMQGLVRDPALRVLGKMPDDINSAGAAFIRQSVRAGMSQKEVGDRLSAQTLKYVYDLDRLQKLTGISADQLQKQQDEAMAEDAYNDVMSELKQRALAGDSLAQAQIEKITTVMSKLGPEMRKEFIASIGGDISAGTRLFMGAPTLMRNIQDETVSVSKTMNDLNRDAANTVGAFGKSARLAAQATRETIGPLYEYRELISGTADFDEREAAAKRAGIVQDKATENLAKMDLRRMNERDAVQSFTQLGVLPATRALLGFTKVAEGVARMLPGAGLGGASSVGSKLDALAALGPGGTGVGGVNGILATIRQRESGGNYGAQAPGSSASGAYQFIDSTWQSLTKKYGIGGDFTSAKLAPKEIQDAIAGKYVQDILKQSGGDVSKVPLAWYTGNVQGKISNSALAANNGLTPETYQSGWMSDYSKIAGPLGGYQSQMSGVNPSKSLSVPGDSAQTTQTLPVAGDDRHIDLLDRINGTLARMLSSTEATAAHTKKSVQLAS
jgi:hypothetical protein